MSPDGKGLTFKQVVEQERQLIECNHAQRGAAGGAPFSVAFSGGGMRAAAFQAGVLWRLAEGGFLKDVEYISAVSGGAYIGASFVSHLLACEPPAEGRRDAWYRGVVAKAICRMQRNAGNFVRDLGDRPLSFPEDGSGLLPRIFDLPLSLGALLLSLVAMPLIALTVVVVPVTEGIELWFGGAMRAAFCAPPGTSWLSVLSGSPPCALLQSGTLCCLLAAFAAWLISKAPAFRLGGHRTRSRTTRFLFVQGALAFLVRASLLLMTLNLIIGGATASQIWMHSADAELRSARWESCARAVLANGTKPGAGAGRLQCGDLPTGVPWYQDPALVGGLEQPARAGGAAGGDWVSAGEDTPAEPAAPRGPAELVLTSCVQLSVRFLKWGGLYSRFWLLAALQAASGVLALCLPGLFCKVFVASALLGLNVLLVTYVRLRIFSLLMGHFDPDFWDATAHNCLVVGLVVTAFFNGLRSGAHKYYTRCLRTNYFHQGRDRSAAEMSSNPYCPVTMFIGTVDDYKRPGDANSISEVSFSCLHTGSEKTGYVWTPEHQSLAKITALSAAGSLDALALSIKDYLWVRFIMAFVNVSWGDYLLFDRHRHRQIGEIVRRLHEREQWVIRKAEGRIGGCSQLKQLAEEFGEELCSWTVFRLPTTVVWLAVYGLMYFGHESAAMEECRLANFCMLSAVGLVLVMTLLSFFAFAWNGLDLIMFSPMIRQVHQMSGFYFQGEKPPTMLYVTDGGVQDNTATVQLVRRQCERILLVLACSDPLDELRALKDMMHHVVDQKLGSFYDPRNPRRDVRMLLDEFREDKEMPFLHLGIRYGWDGGDDDAERTGHLFVVKNRLPPSFESRQVPPHLSEREIKGEFPEEDDWELESGPGVWASMRQTSLGGYGCWNCCHRRACPRMCRSRRFPHLSWTGWLYLTPQLFNCLCRLGHDISGPAVEGITQMGPLEEHWEATVAPAPCTGRKRKVHAQGHDPWVDHYVALRPAGEPLSGLHKR